MSGASTPCINICVIDQASGLCEGCGRTLQEIAQWGALSEAERLAIMAVLPGRQATQDEARDSVWGKSRTAG
ncbi:DUF1289 domain-containing protein [Bosea caraganae]|uniref:DUF1289 domain-containing protein n=1 Tax=Bosea caraganae TaxID=2763117 RepID=A0A370L3B1_9HYPH|nr:DUF1289 domain-containing protein [Bosea caraganae]RDJ22922.1 DUF1289 domain-containing protein [Bosea caraganae]RDJ28702.1 DUF1289 domain-containing protein [Bosea caraganae]